MNKNIQCAIQEYRTKFLSFCRDWRIIRVYLKDFCIKENKLYLLDEWDNEKNLPYTPENIRHSSSVKVWWKCENGHSWQTQLKSRSASRTRCPKCYEEELAERRKK